MQWSSNKVNFQYNTQSKGQTLVQKQGQLPNNIFRVIMVFVISFSMVIIPFGCATLLATVISFEELGLVVICPALVIYTFVFLYLITKVGEWSTIQKRRSKITIPSDQLIKNIFDLENKLPVKVIRINENTLKITWNYANEKFIALFKAGMIYEAYELKLKIDDRTKNIYAQETRYSVSLGAGGVLMPRIAFGGRFFRGISLFEFDYAEGYGFTIKDGKLVFDNLYTYNFNSNELKAPLIMLVTLSGWNYYPKVWL